MTWVPRALWGDEVSFAPAIDQGPALGGLQGVVVAAEPVEQFEHRDVLQHTRIAGPGSTPPRYCKQSVIPRHGTILGATHVFASPSKLEVV
jgi:hypothetical protein